MRKIAVLVVAALALTVSACNTVRGVGQDLEAAGEGVQCTVQGTC
ncbi:MAG: entericidin A/B family lipoprotein [Brevundimonas sp.]